MGVPATAPDALPGTPEQVQGLLIAFELAALAIAHLVVFRWEDFAYVPPPASAPPAGADGRP
jgi:hypothetical protein